MTSLAPQPSTLGLYGPQDYLQVAVYAKDNPDRLLDVIPLRQQPEYLDEFGSGGGSFVILKSDPRLTDVPDLLDYTNTVRVTIGGRLIGRWIIMKRTDVLVGEGEDAEAAIQVSGPGLRHWFSNAIVYPDGPLSALTPTTRVFSFATVSTGIWYTPAQWRTPVSNGTVRVTAEWGTAPEKWPDAPSAQWIWDRDQRGGAQNWAPQGDVYFRRTFSTSDARTDLDLFITADNFFAVYLDGQLLLEKNEKSGGAVWTQVFKEEATVGPGTHVLAVRATNEAYGAYPQAGPGALAVAMFRRGNAATGAAAQLLFVSDANAAWKMLPYPANPPGFSPGELLKVLFDEARVRGVRGFSWLTVDFSETTDSNGVPWPRDLSWEFAVGKEYEDVVKKIEEVMADVWIDPVTLKIKVYQQKGVDRSRGSNPVLLAPAFNLTSAEVEGEADAVKNTLLLGHSAGLTEWRDAAKPTIDREQTEAKYGRIEGFLNVGKDASQERAEVVAEATYPIRALPQESTTVEFVVVSGHVPWVDFGIGDWVLAPGRDGRLAKRRVMSLAVKEDDETGRVIYSAEFDSVYESRAKRIERWLENTADGTLGGTVANSSGRLRLTELAVALSPGAGGGAGGGVSPGQIIVVTASTTLAPSHLGGTLECDFAATGEITVPSNATYNWPLGSQVSIRQIGAGRATVVGATGVLVRFPASAPTATGTAGQWSTITVQKRATDEWVVSGDVG